MKLPTRQRITRDTPIGTPVLVLRDDGSYLAGETASEPIEAPDGTRWVNLRGDLLPVSFERVYVELSEVAP